MTPGFRAADVETVPEIGTELDEQEALTPPWQVIIYNDPVNLMTYVAAVIRRIFGYDQEKAHRLMLDVHHKGKAIVWTGEQEKAEFYVQQLQSYQLLAAMKKAG
ncbi:ATP-dependent Clp protease adapter ClpS [soil metagenome]